MAKSVTFPAAVTIGGYRIDLQREVEAFARSRLFLPSAATKRAGRARFEIADCGACRSVVARAAAEIVRHNEAAKRALASDGRVPLAFAEALNDRLDRLAEGHFRAVRPIGDAGAA